MRLVWGRNSYLTYSFPSSFFLSIIYRIYNSGAHQSHAVDIDVDEFPVRAKSR